MDELTGWFDSFGPYLKHTLGDQEVTVLLDSGFSGDLWLPREVLDRLGWPEVSAVSCQLADEQEIERPVHLGKFKLFGKDLTAYAIEGTGSSALVGMHLFREVRIELSLLRNVVSVKPEGTREAT